MSKSGKTERNCVSRRTAIKYTAAATAAGIVGLEVDSSHANPPEPLTEKDVPATGPGHVVCVHKPGMKTKTFPDAAAAREMVEKAITTLAGEKDLAKAWGKFVSPTDKVGIKINMLGGKFAGTTKEVVMPIVEGVKAAGVPDENIMIFDQFGGNMRGGRYPWQEKTGKMRVINHEVLGYEDDYTRTEGGGKGKFAKTLTWCTAVINVPVIKDHDLAGITCAMKNMVFGCVERPPMMHREIKTALPHFYAHDKIRGKVRLTIADGSFCLFDGGPKNNPRANVSLDRVYATTDPVAMDAICAEVVEEHRKKKGMRSLADVRRPVTHLELSQKLGLGIGERDKIRLETIELHPVA